MNLDKISQAVLVIFGALILILLVMGLLVSCGRTSRGSADLLAPITAVPGVLLPTPLVVAAGPSPTPSVTPAPTATPTAPAVSGGIYTPGSTVRHVVSRGEWLLQIARCYGVSYAALWVANPIPNPNYILPGQILTVPDIGREGAITGAPCVVAYTVVAGDTWESLALRHGTTTAILQRANPGALSVGRSIWVPRIP